VADGAAVLQKAVAATSNCDKLGLKLSGFEFSESESSVGEEIAYDGNSYSYAFTSLAGALSLSNASASLMAEGLTSSDGADFKAVLSAQADVAYSSDTADFSGSQEIKRSLSQSGVSASFYVADKHLYFDASSTALASLITGYLQSSESGLVKEAFASGKYDLGALFSDASFPIFDSSAVSSFQSLGSEVANDVSQFSPYFNSVKYSDGSYGLSISLTKDDLRAILLKTNGSGSSAASSLPATVETELSSLTITSLSAGLVYTDSGIKTLKTDVDLSISETLGDVLSGNAFSLSSSDAARKLSSALKIKGTLDVLTGDEVTVTIPDLSDYVVVNNYAQ
jgi:hypothetical protein